ncbi:transcriptional regulator [Roseomonas nepalensis]|uniref:Transcriptional regulator n=1 Tax=Muricoccus nepalensis TaxID=1854500 RepID=A0A502FJF4_9PROT|nr:helix-turn-helix transcriptional regulator [Roseomonas nepalensis]TPG49306.1 transcriptional regulator [Roseomonas nepalensis]
MTPEQCREARALLGWTEVQLANHAGIKVETVRYVEAGNGRPKALTLAIIRTCLEAAGVEFILASGDSAGVQMREAEKR